MDIDNFSNYLDTKYQKFYPLLRFGRLPVHELLKIECAIYGEIQNYEVKAEFRVGRSRRIDVVWIKYNKIVTAIEIDEGLNYRAIEKVNMTHARNKIFIFFDVKKIAQRKINNFDFKNISMFVLRPRGNQG